MLVNRKSPIDTFYGDHTEFAAADATAPFDLIASAWRWATTFEGVALSGISGGSITAHAVDALHRHGHVILERSGDRSGRGTWDRRVQHDDARFVECRPEVREGGHIGSQASYLENGLHQVATAR